jgi:hypothetical protein
METVNRSLRNGGNLANDSDPSERKNHGRLDVDCDGGSGDVGTQYEFDFADRNRIARHGRFAACEDWRDSGDAKRIFPDQPIG